MKQLEPGIYEDGAGGLHVDIPELLRHHGCADTPANREQLTRAAEAMTHRRGIPVTVTDEPINKDA